MEYPYIAVLYTPENALQTHHARPLIAKIQRCARWRQVILRNGIALFTGKPSAAFLRALPIAHESGAILGTLFQQGTNVRLLANEIAEDPDFAEICLRTRGEHLRKAFWGTYVAFLSHPRTGDWSIARDCSGMIPCYYTNIQGATVAFSDVRDLDELLRLPDLNESLFPREINWRYVVGFLASSQMQIRETGLKNGFELLAGETLEFCDGRMTVRPLWNPVPIAIHDPSVQIDIAETRRVLRETAQSCIAAWGCTQDRILHSLSGGFDSSLVLSLLQAAPRHPDVLCINRFAMGPGEDERRYAQIAARWARADLLELPWDSSSLVLDHNCQRLTRTAKPTLPHLFNGLDAPVYNRLGVSRGCDTIWTGQGGDHLFMAMHSDFGLADSLAHHGLMSSCTITALNETAKLTRKSMIHLARVTIGRTLHIRHRNPRSQDAFFTWTGLLPQTRLLGHACLPAGLAEYIRHPWAGPSAVLPPGKRYQLLLLAEVLNRHRPLYGLQRVQEFHPLLSQPLIEVCLRTPIYLLLSGGQNRGLARQAFRDCLPHEIVARQGKGQTTHFALDLLRRSKPFVTEVLIDGALAKQGILERSALETALHSTAHIDWTTLYALLTCLAAEVWLQNWLSPATVGPRDSAIGTTIHSREWSTPPAEARPERPSPGPAN